MNTLFAGYSVIVGCLVNLNKVLLGFGEASIEASWFGNCVAPRWFLPCCCCLSGASHRMSEEVQQSKNSWWQKSS